MAGIPNIDIDPPKYGPPNMAAQLFGMISSLPDAYQQGAKNQFERGQMARTERLQQPIGLDGTDYSTLVRKLLEAKGTEAIPEVLPTAWKSEFAAGAGRPNVWDTPQGGGPNMSPTDQTGSTLNDAAARQGQGPVATDRRGPLNVRQIAIDAGVDPETPGFADQFRGPGLDRPIHPSNVQGVKDKIANLQQAGMFGPQGDQPEATASFDQRFGSAVPGPRGGPAQGPTPAGPQAAMAPAGVGPGAGSGLVPPGWLRGAGKQTGYPPTELGYAQWLQAQAQRNSILGFNEAAKGQQAHADKILGAIEAVDPAKIGFERAKGIEGKRTDQAFTRSAGIEKAGSTAEDAGPQIATAKRLVNSPGFNAGIGTPFVDTMKQLSASLFGDPNAATPSQFFDKLRGGTILNEIRSLSASGAGVVRVPEMKFIDSMIAGRDMQPPSIRSAVEVESRLNQRVQDIYHLQQQYLQTHPQLDEGFNRVVTRYKETRPLFSEKEMTHPDLLGAPSAPLVHDPRAAMQWAQQMGIKPGDPIRTPPMPGHPNGQVVAFDPAAFK
jgi:hypothetical protein